MERYDKDFLGLEVVSLQEASVVGEVEGLILDDQAKAVAALVVNTGSYQSRVLPYSKVRGVGDDAVVIDSADVIKLVTEEPGIEPLASRDAQVAGSYLLTARGQLLGYITGFLLDSSSGAITQLAVVQNEEDEAEAEGRPALLLPADAIQTVGPDLVIAGPSEAGESGCIVAAGDLLGLPIVSSVDGRVLADVDDIIVDDAGLKLAGLLVNLGLYEPQVLAFVENDVIGPDAVLTAQPDAIQPLTAQPDLAALADRRLSVEGARTVTLSGKSVGFISQYYVNPTDRSISGLQFLPESSRAGELTEGFMLPLAKVVRMGRELVVVQDDFASALVRLDQPAPSEAADSATAGAQGLEAGASGREGGRPPRAGRGSAEPEQQPAPATEEMMTASPSVSEEAGNQPPAEWAVEEQQTGPDGGPKHYLLGRRVMKRLEAAGGRLIADIGDVVTPEVIEQARNADLLLILSLNVE